ncbi:MAG: quinone oxidoreductase [Actinomycetales bacterium]|nr:quinone oxidoreductase [Actinomycetales bacterium]
MTVAEALRVPRHGDVSVLTLESLEIPDPRPGQVRVRVAAGGVNFIDVYQREGIYPMTVPYTPGMEGAGTVDAVGDGAGFLVGDRVAWAMRPSAHAQLALVGADALVPVPDDLDLETAAAAMLQGMTAQFLTRSTYPVQEGTRVLVHAAAGGVGQWLVQVCRALGATVIATAGSQQKCAIATSLGAAAAVNYTEHDTPESLAAAVRDAAEGGIDVAYDGVGKATFDASLASLRPRGMVVLFGGSSGQVPPLDLQRLNAAGSAFVTRPSLGHHAATREELLWRSGEVFGWLLDGTVKLSIGGRFPLREAAAAYEQLESRGSTGKLLLIP